MKEQKNRWRPSPALVAMVTAVTVIAGTLAIGWLNARRTWQRAWADTGSVVVLDPKGELYDQTAHMFRNVYRIDLQKPERSDRWNFLPDCTGAAYDPGVDLWLHAPVSQ